MIDGDSGTCIVRGLVDGTTYTLTAAGRNVIGTTIASAASNDVTPIATPDRPTAEAGDASATVSVAAVAGATAIAVAASDGVHACQISGGSCVVSGLVNGVAYRFSAVGSNASGASDPSGYSVNVTPAAPAAPAAAPTPIVPPAPVADPDAPETVGPDVSSGPNPPAMDTAVQQTATAVNTAFTVKVAGSLTQLGVTTVKLKRLDLRAGGPVKICSSSRTISAPLKSTKMRCTLTSAARAYLKKRTLSVTITTTFTPKAGGAVSKITRRFVLRVRP